MYQKRALSRRARKKWNLLHAMRFFILWNYFRNIMEFQASSSKWFFDWQDTDEVMISKYFYLDLIQIAMPPGVWGDQHGKKKTYR